jgi:hypothetical protein
MRLLHRMEKMRLYTLYIAYRAFITLKKLIEKDERISVIEVPVLACILSAQVARRS